MWWNKSDITINVIWSSKNVCSHRYEKAWVICCHLLFSVILTDSYNALFEFCLFLFICKHILFHFSISFEDDINFRRSRQIVSDMILLHTWKFHNIIVFKFYLIVLGAFRIFHWISLSLTTDYLLREANYPHKHQI